VIEEEEGIGQGMNVEKTGGGHAIILPIDIIAAANTCAIQKKAIIANRK
jgi:hypothetical protein